MGLLHLVLSDVARALASVSDVPGVPPGVGPAIDPIIGGRDPTLDDVMGTLGDFAGMENPVFPGKMAEEAYKRGKKNVRKYNRRKRKKLDDILENAREGNPDG